MNLSSNFLSFAGQLFEPVLVFCPQSEEILFANDAAKNFFGFGDDFSSLTLLEIVADTKLRISDISEAIKETGKWSGQDIILHGENNQKVSSNINAAFVESGEHFKVALMIQNRSTKDLADLGQDVRKIAHDIRGALASAQLMCDRFSEHEDSQVRRASELLARSLNRVLQMCVHILQVGKTKKVEPRPVQFYLSDLISDLNASMLGSDHQSVVSLNATEEIFIEADYDQIYRVLLNLCRNARNAGASHIVISGVNGVEGAKITISDDGPGIPEETIPSLFKTKTQYSGNGTGLGLIITHEIVASHKGSIELVKNDNQGAIFSIYLPHDTGKKGAA